MKHPLIILLSACFATASFVGWRLHAMRTQRVNHHGVVWDPSLSYAGGCESLVGAAEMALLDPNVTEKSTLSILVLGDNSTAREPRRIATYPIPTSLRVIDGQRVKVERQSGLLQDLRSRCESLRPTSISPIFLAVKQALADLQSKGCKYGSGCRLWVSSDLEENGVSAIRDEINRVRAPKRHLPEPLANDGVTVTFCGFAQTAGHVTDPTGRELRKGVTRDPRRDDRLQSVWRALFTRPELISFEPYCPESHLLESGGTAASSSNEGAGSGRN